MPRLLSLLVLVVSFALPVRAAGPAPARLWLHLNGYTYHFVAQDCNSWLLGSGLTWYTHDSDRLRTAWEADAFEDSARKLAAYAGYSVVLPFRWVGFGATGAIMYHRNFVAEDRLRILPVVIPFLEFGQSKWKLRVYYVPGVRRRTDEQVSVQLLIPLWK